MPQNWTRCLPSKKCSPCSFQSEEFMSFNIYDGKYSWMAPCKAVNVIFEGAWIHRSQIRRCVLLKMKQSNSWAQREALEKLSESAIVRNEIKQTKRRDPVKSYRARGCSHGLWRPAGVLFEPLSLGLCMSELLGQGVPQLREPERSILMEISSLNFAVQQN